MIKEALEFILLVFASVFGLSLVLYGFFAFLGWLMGAWQ